MTDEPVRQWLAPMIEEGAKRGLSGGPFAVMMQKAAYSTAEADGRGVIPLNASNPNTEVFDLLRLGELLREALGWEETYPARPPGYDAET
jgi:hypothetical protein